MSASLSAKERQFLNSMPVARLATADAEGVPHVIPICFVIIDDTLYFAHDQKPKKTGARPLKRVRNLLENPRAAVVVDHYENDWERLGWVMIHGRAEVLSKCAEQVAAHDALRRRYVQYREMYLEPLPVVAIRIERVVSWGSLEASA